MEIDVNGQKINFLMPKNYSERKTGLINHYSLPLFEGLIYKKNKIFHTIGLRFSITVTCTDKNFNYICNPVIVHKNSIFIVPMKAYYTLEMNNQIYYKLEKNNFHKKIKIINIKNLNLFFNFLKFFKIIFFLLFIFIFSYSIFAEEEIRISPGRTRIIDLGKPPLTIQISDPDVLEVERIGITNSIKIIPKQEGESKITVIYPAGEEMSWLIHIGKKNLSKFSHSLEKTKFSLDAPDSKSAINIIAKKIKNIDGLNVSINGEKIIIMGSIKSLNSFVDLSRIVSSNPTLFFPIYDIPNQIETPIISYLQQLLSMLGERNLKINIKSGIFTLTGVPSSPSGKIRAWNYLSSVLPNLIDAMNVSSGDSSIIQINLDFLELAKGEGSDFGFSPPIFSNVSSNLIFPEASNSLGIQEPKLQIGPISSLFKALQSTSFARELAKPVVITRSGEKASFLAGGEVPIVTATSTSSGTTSSVTYRPFGILFNVTPSIQVDGSIWMKLDFEVSQISEDLSYQNIPGFTSRKISTSIILNEGNTAILSGLVQNKDVKQIQKVPLLGKIPIIGELFKSRRFQENNTELLVAINAIKNDINIPKKFLESKFDNYKNKTTINLLD